MLSQIKKGEKMALSLDKLREKAQRDANRDGKALVILNLNRFSPLYVIRDAKDLPADYPIVCMIEPTTE